LVSDVFGFHHAGNVVRETFFPYLLQLCLSSRFVASAKVFFELQYKLFLYY
jgi:hypothetical protein